MTPRLKTSQQTKTKSKKRDPISRIDVVYSALVRPSVVAVPKARFGFDANDNMSGSMSAAFDCVSDKMPDLDLCLMFR